MIPAKSVDSHQVAATQTRGDLLAMERIVTPSAVRFVGERATSDDDFLPSGVQEKPRAPALEPFVVSGGVLKDWRRPAYNSYCADVAMHEPGKIELNQFWFPGWKTSLDNRWVEAKPSGKIAILSCDVPAGDHTIEFKYCGLPQRQAGLAITSLSIIAAAAMIALPKSPRKFSEGIAL